jgi:hypothetical protein
MPDVVNHHFILPDLVHDQIVTDHNASELAAACRLPDVWRGGYPRSRVLDASHKTSCRVRIVRSNVRKNLIEIGEGAAFISKLHALR